MAKLGRPFVYQSDTEKPVTVSVRIPRDVYSQVERYVKMHPGTTLTEFVLDGIRLRLATPADPRDIILSDDNTVMQEVQEMIRAAVQREVGKLSAFMPPHVTRPGVIPPPEAATEVRLPPVSLVRRAPGLALAASALRSRKPSWQSITAVDSRPLPSLPSTFLTQACTAPPPGMAAPCQCQRVRYTSG